MGRAALRGGPVRIGRRGLLAGLALAGCAGQGTVEAELDAAIEGELRRRPGQYVNGEARAWAVSREGAARGTLWGTIHLRYSGDTVMPGPVRERFYGSASLTVEDLGTPARIQALRAGQREALRRRGAPPLDAGTTEALRRAGVAPGEEAGVSLLGLASLVAERAPREPAGDLPPTGIVDANLVGFARSMEMPVRALEALDAPPDPVWREPNGAAAAAALRLTLRRIAGLRPYGEALLREYGRGNVGRVLAGAVAWRAEPEDLRHADASRAVVLGARNRAWVAPLEQTFARPGLHFVAFGCGHLPGTDGVVALLRERGWDVRPCGGDRCG